jgi:phosphoglycolate phosphatase-like HAD superfamily hydrolase
VNPTVDGARLLVLFDIDGTLLSTRRAFLSALSHALETTYGTPGPVEAMDFSGKTDPQIVRELMRGAAIAEETIDAGLAAALDLYREGLIPLLDASAVTAKQGVQRLMERLASEPRVVLGLLTGNLEPCARAKLEPLGLNRYFAFGAYGSDHEDRLCLPAVALRRAEEATGHRFAGPEAVVVGDSIHDVHCGRVAGARTVAVATGRTSRERLAAEGPDALFEDFEDTEAVVSAILGRY